MGIQFETGHTFSITSIYLPRLYLLSNHPPLFEQIVKVDNEVFYGRWLLLMLMVLD